MAKLNKEERSQLQTTFAGNIIDFTAQLKLIHGKRKKVYNDGPSITFDSGYTLLSLAELILETGKTNPTRANLTAYFVQYGLPDMPGLYLLESGERKSVITTQSIAKSCAKVVYEMLHTQKSCDVFTKRLCNAKLISFKILCTGVLDYKLGAKYAGIYDVMNPAVQISERGFNYRKRFPGSYKKGLVIGGNFTTIMIERCLLNGSRPSFITEKEANEWIGNFIEQDVIPDDVFSRKVFQLIDESRKNLL